MSQQQVSVDNPLCGNKGMKGFWPSSLNSNSSLGGGQVTFQAKTAYNVNLIRFLTAVTTSGTAGTGTGTTFTSLLQRIQAWQGDSDGGTQVLDINNYSLQQAYRASILREILHGSVSTTSGTSVFPRFSDVTLAGSATYAAWADIVLEWQPGDYYFQFDYTSIAALPGYSTAPTGGSFSAAVALVDFGYPVNGTETMVSGLKASSSGYNLTNVNEAYLEGANDNKSNMTITFNGQSLNSYALGTIQSIVQDKLGSTSIYGIYLSAPQPAVATLQIATAENDYFVGIAYALTLPTVSK